MASQSVTASSNSRLTQLQIRFQQKQIGQREQKRIDMTARSGDHEPVSKNIGNGKVRQMFDERRRGVGIDRSHPLKPITTTTTAAKSTSRNTVGAATAQAPVSLARKPLPQAPVRGAQKAAVNGRSEILEQALGHTVSDAQRNYDADELDFLGNEIFSKGLTSLSLNEKSKISDDRNNNEAHARGKSSNNFRLNPVVTKKSPTVATTKAHVRSKVPASPPPPASRRPPSSGRTGVAPSSLVGRSSNRVTPEKPASATAKNATRSSAGKTPVAAKTQGGVKPPPRIIPPAPGMATCRYCNRNFNEDRLAKHEQVCQKMANSKRKVFDASKHRVMGTEAEKYVKKPQNARPGGGVMGRNPARMTSTHVNAAAASGKAVTPKKNNWRKKHEDFIAAIRAAKQVQSHLARGGKLSDLPPPPPSDNPDYIQCPHCLRRFNETAAERHIPRCATMLHNKPKPGAPPKRR